MWQLTFEVPEQATVPLECCFEDVVHSASSFKHAKDNWLVRLITKDKLKETEIKRRIQLVVNMEPSAKGVRWELQELGDTDWVSLVQEQFKPFRLGRFFIYGHHYTDPPPHGYRPLNVGAGAAFGTGEHATTQGCLLALEWLKRIGMKPTRALDMGCGTGILLLGAAHLWPKLQGLAVEIDKMAVSVAQDNIVINHKKGQLHALYSDGYKHPRIRNAAPYDIIISNILARPLVKMADIAHKHVKSGGYIILSGLLARQERMVRQAYEIRGMHCVKRIPLDEWVTLTMQKN